MRRRSGKRISGFIVIGLLGLTMATIVHLQSQRSYNAALEQFRKSAHTESQMAADAIGNTLSYLNQSLFTISMMPSVRNLSKQSRELAENDRDSIEQIYMNVGGGIEIAEIYIVPADFNPNAIDSKTGKPEAPLAVFDHKVKSDEAESDISEDESFEYKQIKDQLHVFKTHYLRQKKLTDEGISQRLPTMLSSAEVTICDNTIFATTRNEADRKGFVFSVPYYDSRGLLAGTVSAIIRSDAMRALLPNKNLALINTSHEVALIPTSSGQALASAEFVKRGVPDPTLFYSAVLPIDRSSSHNAWAVWAGRANDDFLNGNEASAIRSFKHLEYAFTALLTVVGCLVWGIQKRHLIRLQQQVMRRSDELEETLNRMQLLETVIQSANDAIIITKADLTQPGPEITYVNEAFTRISGYSAEEAIGKSPRFLQSEFTKRETLEAMRLALEEGKPFKDELLNRHKNGQNYWLEISVVPIRNAAGEITHYAAVERDISARKQEEIEYKNMWVQLKRANMQAEVATQSLQESLKKAEEASKAKSDFLANMSHELRTPMNGVLGMAQLLADTALDDDQRECVNTINGSGEALLMLLNDILDFSKIEAGALVLEDISYQANDVFEHTAQLLSTNAHKKGIELLVDIDANIPQYLMGDPGRMRQIITNLIGNAIKFTDRGYVRLSARALDEESGKKLQVRVEDTGIGIPADKLKDIFEKFTQADASVTRKYGGTGLGLAITRELIGMMGGQIGVESVEGKGSTFWFSVPCVEATYVEISPKKQVVALHKHLNGERIHARDARVLLVEDYPVNQVFAQKLLSKFGLCNIELAENGAEALKKYRSNRYDVIFMDCQMPEIDGYQATAKIREIETDTPLHTPIIAMTANAMMGDREKCLKAGMDDYMSKPLRAEHLRAILQSMFVLDETKAVIAAPAKAEAPTLKMVDTPAVDVEQLRIFTGDDPAEEKALGELFLDQAKEIIEILNHATSEDAQEKWKSAAHRFKGASGNLGATKLYELCKHAEHHFTETAAQKAEMLTEILEETKRVEAYFAKAA